MEQVIEGILNGVRNHCGEDYKIELINLDKHRVFKFYLSFKLLNKPFLSKYKVAVHLLDDRVPVVLLTDINEGVSVTNGCEEIANKLRQILKLPVETLWAEYYKEDGDSGDVDQIMFRYNVREGGYYGPEWKRIAKQVLIDKPSVVDS